MENKDIQWTLEDSIPMDIHTAASLACDHRVEIILQNSEDKNVINSQNKEGWTPLMYAVRNGYHDTAKMLIGKGAAVSVCSQNGLTALMLAAKCGSLSSISLLMDNGATIDARDSNGWTALFHAIFNGHRSVLRLLMERGCKVDIKDVNSVTPLMLATEADQALIVKDLQEVLLKACAPESFLITKCHGQIPNNLGIQNCCSKEKQQVPMPDLVSILDMLGLSKYYSIFEKCGIDIDQFWDLTDDNLKQIGILCLGPRRKILTFISKWNPHEAHPS